MLRIPIKGRNNLSLFVLYLAIGLFSLGSMSCDRAGAKAIQISAGLFHTCAVLENGTVRCWGADIAGGLGTGSTSDRHTTPVAVQNLSGVAEVATGFYHSCARLQNGTALCWGANRFGNLGDGSTTDRLQPTAVSGLSGVTTISTHGEFVCAMLSHQSSASSHQPSSVSCWGTNGYGALGDGTLFDRGTPAPVAGLANVKSISASTAHACVVLEDGSARCWGLNAWGQIGDGTNTNHVSPVAVQGLTSAASIAAGNRHTCAVLTDATIRCWGSNATGALGDGTTTDRLAPVAVVNIGNAKAVSVGIAHSCALLIDGTVSCWGARIGSDNPLQASQLTPAQVPGLSDVIQISGFGSHTCALTKNGAVFCWGGNEEGQLGDGSTRSRSAPVRVLGLR